ncbi:3-hydroxy-3-methylglutaryl coenzyme A synthase [Mitosporidium daphniae]
MSTSASMGPVVSPSQGNNFGILAMEIYFPSLYVSQSELECHDNVSQGKYTKGLGQTNMAVCAPCEDICSISLNAVSQLMSKYKISYQSIGRLEVGTETLIDKSKSIKSVIMDLFNGNGCYDVEGVDVKNACYGGVAAFFNTIAWMESSCWDGRLGLVVAGDIAVYERGPARPTGGAGVVAILVGPNAPIVCNGVRASHMKHAYDFFKPNLSTDFPIVDGPLSLKSYFEALSSCYRLFRTKRNITSKSPLDAYDFYLFHSPFGKLVQKALSKLYYEDINSINDTPDEALNFDDKTLENEMLAASQELFLQKTQPTLACSRELGNIYCGALFSGLISLICSQAGDSLIGKKCLLFAYGSGYCSSMFELRITSSVEYISKTIALSERLSERTKISPIQFSLLLDDKGHAENAKFNSLVPNRTIVLSEIDAKCRRIYQAKSEK